MALEIPDQGEALSDIQSILFQEDIDVSINDVPAGMYVKSGLVVTAQGVPNMTVQVTAGVAYSKTRFPVAASASLAIAAADLTNPRLDKVVVTSAGALAVRTGTPAAFTTTTTPKPPALTEGDVAIAQILVPAGATAITAAHIKDRRYLIPNLDWTETEVGAYNNIFTVLPASGTTSLNARGGGITTGGTVSHPQPAITNRVTQLWRARYANIATTANQILGFHQNSTLLKQFWRGNANNLGGFYFRGKMTIELWPAATVRLFCGMSSASVSNVVSDTLAGDCCGLWHATNMGATVLNFVTRNNVTTNTIAIPLAAPMAAGQGYELIMYCKPNDTVLYYKVIDLVTGNTLADSFTSTNLPRNTIFLGAEIAMSNAANATVTTTAPGIVECEVRSPAIRT